MEEKEKIYDRLRSEGWELYYAFGSRLVLIKDCQIVTISIATNKILLPERNLSKVKAFNDGQP